MDPLVSPDFNSATPLSSSILNTGRDKSISSQIQNVNEQLEDMDFLRQIICTSRPNFVQPQKHDVITSSIMEAHDDTPNSIIESYDVAPCKKMKSLDFTTCNIEAIKTLHFLNMLEDEIITEQVTALETLTSKHLEHNLKSYLQYYDLTQQGMTQSQSDYNANLFEFRVAVKVVRIQDIENAFKLVRNIITNEKIKPKPKEDAGVIAKRIQEHEQLRKQLAENRKLKSEISQLEEELANADEKDKEFEANIVKEVSKIIDPQLDRIQNSFVALCERTKKVSTENKNRRRKIQHQENLVAWIRKMMSAKHESVSNEINQLEKELSDVELNLQRTEKECEDLTQEILTLRAKLEEQKSVGEMNKTNYDEELAVLMKNREEFKKEIERRNELRCQTLRGDNERLRKENYEFSFKLTEMGLRQIFL